MFEVAICDLKAAVSSLLSWNMKSAGERSRFRFTCSTNLFVSTLGVREVFVEHHLPPSDDEDLLLDRRRRDQLSGSVLLPSQPTRSRDVHRAASADFCRLLDAGETPASSPYRLRSVPPLGVAAQVLLDLRSGR